MSARKRQLEARRAAALASARALTTAADAANRDLSAEEQAQFDGFMSTAVTLKSQIAGEEALALEEAGLHADRSVDIGGAQRIETKDNAADDQKRGFQSFGDFATMVKTGSSGGRVDPRLQAAAPGTTGNEGSGTDGGFLVPPEFSKEIFNLSLEEDSLLMLASDIKVKGNSMVFPKDETTPWGTDGVRAYWQAEASAATATKPKFGTSAMRLHKLMALVPITDELLDDSDSIGSYLPELAGRSIRWKANEALLFGTGVGQPLGAYTNAGVSGPSVVQVKESAQASGTIVLNNVTNMIARLPPGSYSRAVWEITPDALPQIFGMQLGNYPIYLPMNSGAAGSPFIGTLMGRPLMVSQHAAALSSQGDLMLNDLSYYRTISKTAGIEAASSMHLYFDADAMAFRFTFRIDGQPKLANPITQAKGSKTLSPFITLQAR